jgi:hypothetical protein
VTRIIELRHEHLMTSFLGSLFGLLVQFASHDTRASHRFSRCVVAVLAAAAAGFAAFPQAG